jgi:arylsulfatase
MSQTPASDARPNIIIILADDMGYSDIGCFGSEIKTPNLDGMAAKGVRFTQMYNGARCCPTRASLLTGLHPHQAGVGHMVGNHGLREYQGYLRDDCVTIAEALRAGGYRTLMSGKWHVGGGYDPLRPETWRPGAPDHPTPRQRGFDRYFGTLDGAGSYFHPHVLLRDDTVIRPEGQNYYYTDEITRNAVEMIEDAAQERKPFFLYLAYTAPHWPLHAPPEDIAAYEGRYRRDGWDGVRAHRHETMKSMGILNPKWDISPRDPAALAWEDAPDRDWEDLRMAVYAAQVARMDKGIGRVLDALRRRGLEENTLVMFLSDNGGCAELLAEDGHSARYATQTPDGRAIRTGNHRGVRPGGADTFMSYDLSWANASNSPFRLYKHWVHEGGIATPLVAQWPARCPAKRIVHAPCHITDFMATCLEVAGAPYPVEYDGRAITPLEGESLLPALQGREWQRQRPIFWEHEGNCAMREGEWKLVCKFPGDWELYNMAEDRTELYDLRAQDRPRAERMIRDYQEWAARCGVREWPLPRKG